MMHISIGFEPVECANCHVQFAVTTRFDKERRADHKSFFCPNGHSLTFGGRSEAEKLREERDRLKQQMAYKDDEAARLRNQRDHAQRSATTYKGHLTRTKRRVSNGVCPCCNRTFKDLARHMETKHTDYVTEAA